MTVRVAVVGASGRMGKAILRSLQQDEACQLVAAVVRQGSQSEGLDAGELAGSETVGVSLSSDLTGAAAHADVVIDFSTADSTAAVLAACATHNTPCVLGTTGLSAETEALLEETSQAIAILPAANTSVGVAVLRYLAVEAAKLLGEEFDLEIVEMHHRHKVDAPSGTATVLAQDLASARGLSPEEALVHGRRGRTGPRKAGEIGVMTLRGGEVIGDHTVHLAGAAERLELTHRAQDRSLFARGAVRAAKWLVGSAPQPGRYGMADVLGLPRQDGGRRTP